MIRFTVEGPLEVPLSKGQIDPVAVRRDMWPAAGALGDKQGCYVFAVPKKRGAQGYRPIYIGKATKSFRSECVTYHKRSNIGFYLSHHPARSLHLYFLVHPPNQGGPNARVTGELERFLIRQAVAEGIELINKHHIAPDRWGIRGLVRGGRGRLSDAAMELGEMFGLVDARGCPEQEAGQRETSNLRAALDQQAAAVDELEEIVNSMIAEEGDSCTS